jgi:hypothetical protein
MTPGTPAPDLIRGLRGGHPDQVRRRVASPMRNVKAILTRPRNPLKSLEPDSCPLRALP